MKIFSFLILMLFSLLILGCDNKLPKEDVSSTSRIQTYHGSMGYICWDKRVYVVLLDGHRGSASSFTTLDGNPYTCEKFCIEFPDKCWKSKNSQNEQKEKELYNTLKEKYEKK